MLLNVADSEKSMGIALKIRSGLKVVPNVLLNDADSEKSME